MQVAETFYSFLFGMYVLLENVKQNDDLKLKHLNFAKRNIIIKTKEIDFKNQAMQLIWRFFKALLSLSLEIRISLCHFLFFFVISLLLRKLERGKQINKLQKIVHAGFVSSVSLVRLVRVYDQIQSIFFLLFVFCAFN